MGDLSKKIKAAGIKLAQPTWVRRPEVLLCPNIPKMMHGIAPRVVLGQKWWDMTRKAAYASTSFCCVACGVWKHDAQYRSWLEGHEWFSVDYKAGRVTYIECVPLCHFCHNAIHSGRLAALLEKGQITHQKYAAILQHKERILKEAGLVVPPDYIGPLAPWGSWRMVLFGKEYPPLYKTREEWVAAFK